MKNNIMHQFEPANTLLVGAIGIIVPQFVQNVFTFALTIGSLIWVLMQIVDKILEWVEKYKK